MAEMLTEDKGISITEAVKNIYASSLYKRLEDEESKIWHEGSVALYQSLVQA